MKLTVLGKALSGVALLFYPVLVFLGLKLFQPQMIVFLLITVLVIKLLANPGALFTAQSYLIAVILACILIGYYIVSNKLLLLKFYPVMVNAGFLVLFSYTLLYPPSMIERIARISQPNLPDAGVLYTKKVTQIWCIFFIINGSIAAYTTFSSIATWTLYNGLIAYILMGLLFICEFLIRQREIAKTK
jgi:uncharacterized membrane protein